MKGSDMRFFRNRWVPALLLCAMTALIAVALTAALLAEPPAATANATADAAEADEIECFRTEREQLRAMRFSQLNEIIYGGDSDAGLAALARREALELGARQEQELTIEGVLRMRGFRDPVVTVHADSVNVLLRAEAVTRQECAVILELCCRETGVQSGNVKIIPIN